MVYKLDLTAIPRVSKESTFNTNSLIDIVRLSARLCRQIPCFKLWLFLLVAM